jgi:c-di-GMP-binding flagellar brake protein YcgR
MSEHVSFMSTIDDIAEEGALSITAPLKQEQQSLIKTGERLRLTCISERGLYMFDAQIIGFT